MKLDELTRGLTTLADEMEPFAGNVGALHRRERRRRVAVASVAAVIVAALAIATVAVTRNGSGKVHVAGVPGKEVSPDLITHIDAIVVPATPAVKAALEASGLVGKYAVIPAGDRSSGQVPSLQASQQALCALQTRAGYAVQAATFAAEIRPELAAILAGRAGVYNAPDPMRDDAEVFMKLHASAQEEASLRRALSSDPDVETVQFQSSADAYARFVIDFAAQPALVERTKPSDLPESFRVLLKVGSSTTAFGARYRSAPGIDHVIEGGARQIFETPRSSGSGENISPCAKP